MQVFRAFFKILWKQKIAVTIYIIIFLGLSLVFAGSGKTEKEESYSNKRYSIAFFDEDQTQTSNALRDYLAGIDTIVEIEDNEETFMDELYVRNIYCVIRVPKGFEEALKKKEAKEFLELTTIPGTMYAMCIEQQISSYTNMLAVYITQELPMEEAVKAANETIEMKGSVSLLNNQDSSKAPAISYFFAYMPYILISALIVGVGPCLLVFGKQEIKARINCSSYRFIRQRMELILSVLVSGAGIGLLFVILASIMYGKAIFSLSGVMYIINMVCFSAVSLSIVFFAVCFAKDTNVLNMIGNIVGLAMSFLGGVFVPMDIMGKGIKAVAKFVPAYWYMEALNEIVAGGENVAFRDVSGYFAIQLAFAGAIIAITIAINKILKEKNI